MKKLARLRVTTGFTQHDVAKMLDVTQAAVSSWERGQGNPSLDKIQRLAVLYGVTSQEIIDACLQSNPQK